MELLQKEKLSESPKTAVKNPELMLPLNNGNLLPTAKTGRLFMKPGSIG